MSVDDVAFLNTALARDREPINPTELLRIERPIVVSGPQDGIYPDGGYAMREFWR